MRANVHEREAEAPQIRASFLAGVGTPERVDQPGKFTRCA